jgi:hypothetical protein
MAKLRPHIDPMINSPINIPIALRIMDAPSFIKVKTAKRPS